MMSVSNEKENNHESHPYHPADHAHCLRRNHLSFVLLVKALRKYIKSKDVREEKKAVCRSLGEALKAHRTEKQMTQEFVAETLGVSRQAVSKWENGTSDPSTSNLCALAKLYGIPVEELLHETQDEKSED